MMMSTLRSRSSLLTGRAYTVGIRAFSEVSESVKGGIMQDVHGTMHGKKSWRNNPLFRREGDQKFRNGIEASKMLIEEARRRDPYQTLFLQAVESVVVSLAPVFDRYPKYAWIMKQLLEPDRVIQFRVSWMDDQGNHRVNRGFRVQYSSAMGPYGGPLRFHPSTGHGTVKFLGFNQIFSNALTGGLGAAAGGSDFNPKGKTESEIRRFCQSYMTELHKYVGPETDLPSCGMGVGPREVGYMYGQYKHITDRLSQPGQGFLWGGRHPMPQATGHGVAYFTQELLRSRGESLEGKRVLVTGCGSVALFTASKLLELGALPVSFSDTSGFICEPDGFTRDKLRTLMKVKSERGARVGGYIMTSTSASYDPSPEAVFNEPCDIVVPCAMQNQITEEVARKLADNGCKYLIEGANMPTTPQAAQLFRKRGVTVGPSSVAASGVGVLNGLAMVRNPVTALGAADEVLQESMSESVRLIEQAAAEYNARGDVVAGANIAGFVKVAEIMLQQGAL